MSRQELAAAAMAFVLMVVGLRLLGSWLGQIWGEPALWVWGLVGYPLAVIVMAGTIAAWVTRRRTRREGVARDTRRIQRVR